MKRLILLLAILFALLILTGCGSIGPYTKNVYIDRENNLFVERCIIAYDFFPGNLSDKECKTEKHPMKDGK